MRLRVEHGYVLADSCYLEVAVTDERRRRCGQASFRSFKNFLSPDARLFRATLLLFTQDGAWSYKAEPLDFGTSLDASDYSAPFAAGERRCQQRMLLRRVRVRGSDYGGAAGGDGQGAVLPVPHHPDGRLSESRRDSGAPPGPPFLPKLRIQWRHK